MATTWDHLVAELQSFRGRREITKALGRGLRAATKPARTAIKAAARADLPHGGGLNVWVARISILTQIRVSGSRAGVKLKGGRNSLGGRSDIRAIDRGRVRAPSWGRRTAGAWHTVTVKPGFFTDTAAALPDWREQCDTAVDDALQTLRRG
jgi:hypothetical protein